MSKTETAQFHCFKFDANNMLQKSWARGNKRQEELCNVKKIIKKSPSGGTSHN